MSWFDELKTPRIKTDASQRSSKVPEGVWVKCTRCGEILQSKTLKDSVGVCPECHFHFRISAQAWITLLTDSEDRKDQNKQRIIQPCFVEYAADWVSCDPLEFNDSKPYKERLRTAAEVTGLGDAFVCGKAELRGLPYHLGVFEFKFMGGSMGVIVGEKATLVLESALHERLPAVIVSSSGGARMQEGILSLMQMAKTAAVIEQLRREGVPYVSVLADPTTGGVAASFAMLGDLVIAEPQALIGFAGPRVIHQTIRQNLPEGFQRSEFLLEHGFVDRIVDRRNLATELRRWLYLLGCHTCRFPKGLTL